MATAIQDTQVISENISGLRLSGNVSLRISDGRALIGIDGIASDRDSGNLSGTLSIQLWALPAPYDGTEAGGVMLAATQIGSLQGQCWLPDCRYDLLFTPPPAGDWHLCLLLREWNGNGYTSCDAFRFVRPYCGTSQEFSEQAADTELPASSAADGGVAVEGTVSLAVSAAGDEADAAPSVSVNHGRKKELAAVKGISEKLAVRIIAGRPYRSLDDLLAVKKMGRKKLAKVRPALTL